MRKYQKNHAPSGGREGSLQNLAGENDKKRIKG